MIIPKECLRQTIKRIALIFVCGLGFCDLNAQNFQWANKGEAVMPEPKITVDASGNSYVYGVFEDTCTFGSFSAISTGPKHIFLCKYDSSGVVQWLQTLGGAWLGDLCTDAAGNIYMIGTISGGIADLGGIILSGQGDYIAKYNPSGSVIWANKIDSASNGGTTGDLIATGDSGSLYVEGRFSYQTTFGCGVLNPTPNLNCYVARFDTSGSCQWVRSFSGITHGIALDKNKSIYVTGEIWDSASFGGTTLYNVGIPRDLFLAKCNSNGSWSWAKSENTSDQNGLQRVNVDRFNHVYVTSGFTSNASFGCASLTCTGATDIFIGCYDTSGNCVWIQQAGGGFGNQYPFGISSDKFGNCIITGSILDTTHFGNYTLFLGSENMFAASYDSTGFCQWAVGATSSQGTGSRATDIEIDSIGNIYVTGSFYWNGTHTFGSLSLTSASYGFTSYKEDIFVVKINNTATGIPNLQYSAFNLQLSPNPTTGTIQLTFNTNHNAPLHCEIINIMGEKVYEKKLEVGGWKLETTLDVSFLGKGIYVMRVGDGSTYQNKKLVIE